MNNILYSFANRHALQVDTTWVNRARKNFWEKILDTFHWELDFDTKNNPEININDEIVFKNHSKNIPNSSTSFVMLNAKDNYIEKLKEGLLFILENFGLYIKLGELGKYRSEMLSVLILNDYISHEEFLKSIQHFLYKKTIEIILKRTTIDIYFDHFDEEEQKIILWSYKIWFLKDKDIEKLFNHWETIEKYLHLIDWVNLVKEYMEKILSD